MNGGWAERLMCSKDFFGVFSWHKENKRRMVQPTVIGVGLWNIYNDTNTKTKIFNCFTLFSFPFSISFPFAMKSVSVHTYIAQSNWNELHKWYFIYLMISFSLQFKNTTPGWYDIYNAFMSCLFRSSLLFLDFWNHPPYKWNEKDMGTFLLMSVQIHSL